MTASFQSRISTYSRRVAGCLDLALPPADRAPARLHEAMRYALFNGGKRVRPLLIYATGECLGVDPDRLDPPATAVELIHAFSLVHDDLPAMDDDDLRRGQPTVHRKYDEATAILAADALQPLAFAVLASSRLLSAQEIVRVTAIVAEACGSLGMTGGQAMDLAAEGRVITAAELQQMHSLKTGALIRAAVMSVCVLAEGLPAARADALRQFSDCIGLAFQIRDDILDVDGKTDVIGKQAGADLKRSKATWPALFGVDGSKRRCAELLDAGLGHLDVFGAAAEPLRWLARYIVERPR